MQYRELGGTRLKTSILGFGGFHLLEIPLFEAEQLLNAYLDAGGNYIETAAAYGDGESERKIGRSIGHRRDGYILASKTDARDKSGAAAQIDRSLSNLKTDYLDLLLMHGVRSVQELDMVLGSGGAYEAALEAKEAGKVRHIAISTHGWPGPLLEALKRDAFEAVMSAINYYDRFNYPEIEGALLPLAQKKGVGVILMKPIADGYLYKSAPQAFRYAFSRPVSVVVAGINSMQMLRDDISYAEAFVPLTHDEEQTLFKEAAELGNYVCRQCGQCRCVKGIDIGEIFAAEGYFDRQMGRGTVGDTAQYALSERLRFWFGNQELGRERYKGLSLGGDACDGCGACLEQCPYSIDIPYKLRLADYKLAGRDIF